MVYANPSNVSGITSALQYVASTTDGMLSPVLLMVIFFISFLSMRNRNEYQQGANASIFLASAFITCFFSVLFYMIGIANEKVIYVCITAVAIGVFANLQSR
jgi:hypothetical protein